jgi:CBS domain-containing protein
LWWVLDRIATAGVLPRLWMAVALYITGQLSFYLGLFSLLPGLPMDGGRMLRVIVWLFSGRFETATRLARIAAQVIAYGLIFLGASSFVADDNWVRAGAFILIGWSIREAGGTAYRRGLVAGLLTRLTAADLMRTHERTVAPEQSLRAFALTMCGRSGVEPTPVVDNGIFLGMIDRNLLRDVPQGYWDTRTVAETMPPAANLVVLEPDTPLNAFVARLMDDAEQAAVLPVLRDGKLVGLIDSEELIDVLELEDEFGVFARRPPTAAGVAPAGRAHIPVLRENDTTLQRAAGQ